MPITLTMIDHDETVRTGELVTYGLPISDETIKGMMDAYSSYTDKGLTKMWNRLETKKLTPDLELTMDWIQAYLYHDRGVIAWDSNGDITSRNER